MPYKGTSQPRGMLHSSHAPPPHSRPIAPSSGGALNPAAGTFKPQGLNGQQCRPPTPTTLATPADDNSEVATAMIPHQPQNSGNDQVTVKVSDLNEVTKSFNDEILSLRREIEVLKQGGWTVTVGAFVPPKQVDLSEVEATRQRLQNSSSLFGALTKATKQIEGPPSSCAALAVQPSAQTHIRYDPDPQLCRWLTNHPS